MCDLVCVCGGRSTRGRCDVEYRDFFEVEAELMSAPLGGGRTGMEWSGAESLEGRGDVNSGLPTIG